MKVLALLLNLPWSILLFIAGLLSIPSRLKINQQQQALVIEVKSFWYYYWLQPGVRAMTLGNVILLGPKLLANDFEHELVHIRQHQRAPFLHPILNFIETLRHGYRNNKYEIEAYSTTNSTYVGHAIK